MYEASIDRIPLVAKAARKGSQRSATAPRKDERPGARLRSAWVLLSLAAVLAIQLWICWGKLGSPFLDTRLHYNYDNADFSFRARSGNRNGDVRSQFGVTVNAYSRWGERVGPPNYNTDHPFLVKALFQQYVKIVGDEEWASRSFYLGVSFAVAAGFYALLLKTTGWLLASFAGAAAFVSLPVFAIYQTSVKFETDGMLVSVWLFVVLMAYLKTGKLWALVAEGILTGLAFLTHWTAILFVGTVLVWLGLAFWRRKDARAKRALVVSLSASVLGLLALVALMSYLQGGWRPVSRILAAAFVVRSEPIPLGTWWARQWLYAELNFTDALVWLVVVAGLLIAIPHRKRVSSARPVLSSPGIVTFAICTLSVALVWLVAFRQGSLIHVYWQYWFSFPIAVLLALAIASVSVTPLGRVGGAAIALVLVIFLITVSRKAYAGVLADQLGTPEDIAFLRSLREDRFSRFVFVPVTKAALNDWFQGPLFQYYTDRPVAIAAAGDDLQEGDKLLVLRYQQRDEVAAGVARWSRKKLANERCGPRFCAYDVLGEK